LVVAVKALACELPYKQDLPLSRHSIPELKREVLRRGLVASIGDTTIWRWLTEDAIQPWRYRTWISPRDPTFELKAGSVLDLYEGFWEGQPLSPDDCIISADKKTSIQGPTLLSRHTGTSTSSTVPRRARIRAVRCLGLLGCLGCAVRQSLWPLRNHDRH
jgi:hypothetical protein